MGDLWIEVIGFIILLLGTLIYNSIIRVPGLKYDTPEPAKTATGDDSSATALLTDTDAGAAVVDGHSLNGGGGGADEGGIEVAGANFSHLVGASTPTLGKVTLLHKR